MPKQKSSHCSKRDSITNLLMLGYRLKQATVNRLEAKLKKDPSDISSRLKLLGYYFRHSYYSKIHTRSQLHSVLWMIQHIPENKVLSQPWTMIDKVLNPTGYERCKKLWLKQLSKRKDDVAVITNAAGFLRDDLRIVERLYRRAIVLEPASAHWPRMLALFLNRTSSKKGPRTERALIAIQESMRKTKVPVKKLYAHVELADIAFNAGEWLLAKKAAQKCLSLAENYSDDWNYGNAIHKGNCILGRLAFRQGKVTKAIFHLTEAGKNTRIGFA